jgi:hypothetical protein
MLLSKRSVFISRWQTAIVTCVPAAEFGPAAVAPARHSYLRPFVSRTKKKRQNTLRFATARQFFETLFFKSGLFSAIY